VRHRKLWSGPLWSTSWQATVPYPRWSSWHFQGTSPLSRRNLTCICRKPQTHFPAGNPVQKRAVLWRVQKWPQIQVSAGIAKKKNVEMQSRGPYWKIPTWRSEHRTDLPPLGPYWALSLFMHATYTWNIRCVLNMSSTLSCPSESWLTNFSFFLFFLRLSPPCLEQ